MKSIAKLLMTLGILTSMAPPIQAQNPEEFVILHCDSPGSLVLSDEARISPYLKITGDIDAHDIAKLKLVTINVTRVLDLSEATICEYTGTEGTDLDLSPNWIWSPPVPVTYPANTLPTQAFTEVRDNSLSKYIRGSYSLQKLILPATLTGFMQDALTNNYVLTQLEVPTSSTTMRSENHLVYSYDGSTLLAIAPAYYGDLTVTESVVNIADGVFKGVTPASVTFKSPKIPVFGENNNINAAYIIAEDPDSYKELFPDIDCIKSIETITVENIQPDQLLLSIGNQGYRRSEVRALKISGTISYEELLQVSQLPNLHIADLSETKVLVDSHKQYTFSNPSVTRFEFPVFENLTSLRIEAICRLYGHLNVPEGINFFSNFSSRLTSIAFPSSLEYGNTDFFGDFSVIESIDFSKCNLLQKIEGPYGYAGNLREVKLPERLKQLSNFAGPVEKINLPNSLESLSTSGGWLVKKLALPPALTSFKIESLPYVTEIDASSATGLTSFSGLHNSPCLKSLDLSFCPIIHADLLSADRLLTTTKALNKPIQRLVSVGGTAYKAPKTTAIEHLSLPSTLQTLRGLSCCQNLKELDLMHCFRLKGINGLNDCPSIESLSLPESISSIEGLQGCQSLATITIAASKPPLYSTSNEGLDFSNITINICYGSSGAYQMSEGWEKCARMNEIGYCVSINTDMLNEILSNPDQIIIDGAGLYKPGQEAILKASPIDHYTPSGWIVNDSQINDNPYSIKVENNITALPAYTIDMDRCDLVMKINAPVAQTFNLSLDTSDKYSIFVDGELHVEDTPKKWTEYEHPIHLTPGEHTISLNGNSIQLFLSGNESPENLEIKDYYSITSFIVNNKELLSLLYLSFLNVDILDLSNSPNLVLVGLSKFNTINTLNASHCEWLNEVDCSDTTPQIVSNLDISHCNRLHYVCFYNCQLENIICDESPIIELMIPNNKLHSLDLSGNSRLEHLNASDNLLTEFKMDATACQYLNLNNNPMAFSTLTPQMYDIYMTARENQETEFYIIDFILDENTLSIPGYIDLANQMLPPSCATPTKVTINGKEVESVDGKGLFEVPKGYAEVILSNETYPNLLYRAKLNIEKYIQVEDMTFDPFIRKMEVGETATINIGYLPADATTQVFNWRNNTPEIIELVKVSENELKIIALNEGTGKFFIDSDNISEFDNISYYLEITVTDDAAVHVVTDDMNYVRVEDNAIIVDSPVEIAIYTSEGRLIYKGCEGRIATLSAGVYIAVANGQPGSIVPITRKLHIK